MFLEGTTYSYVKVNHSKNVSPHRLGFDPRLVYVEKVPVDQIFI
jgi:hypothetical protein